MILTSTQSDLDGCDSFVFTARSYGFYETLGYTVVGKSAVGAGNPTWHHKPAEVYLVSGHLFHPRSQGTHEMRQMYRPTNSKRE